MITTRLRKAAGQVQRLGLQRLGRQPSIDFLVIGAQKSGTTTLYELLARHPRVHPPYRKELHYFDNQYERGLDWYRRQMPTEASRDTVLTGEATPYYLFHPLVPARVKAQLPEVKLVAVLRDPGLRAYSHYQHNRRQGVALGSFAQALHRETELEAARGHLPGFPDEPDRHRHSYRARGLYAHQLQGWYRHFAPEQLLVLRAEDLFADEATQVARVTEFLGLPPAPAGPDVSFHSGGYDVDPADKRALDELREFYLPHNARLVELLGPDFAGWNR